MSILRTAVAATFLGVLVGVAAPAAAQRSADALALDEMHASNVVAAFEMDPAMGFRLGYGHALDLDVERFHRRLVVHGDLSTILDASSWSLVAGASMFLAEGTGPNVLLSTDLELGVAQNDVHTAITYGYAAALRPGWYDPAWFLAAEVSLHGTFAATLLHTDAYRALQPGVRDGTYLTENLSFFFGGAIGFLIEHTVLVGVRFAWRVPRTFASYAPYVQPYTANVEIGARF